MKYIIEVEETAKFYHQILVEINDEEQIDTALEKVERNDCCSLDDFVDSIKNDVSVEKVYEDSDGATEKIEYHDSYPDKE